MTFTRSFTRRGFSQLLAGAGLGAFLPSRGRAEEPPAEAVFPKLGRGINLHHLLNWPDTKTVKGQLEYVWPPFRAENYQMPDAEIARLKTLGFDFVRITVDPSIFLSFTGARREELLRIARATATRFLGQGLKVIVDLHPVDVNPRFAPEKLLAGIRGSAFQSYADVVEAMARTLHDLPHDQLAFELMNEPHFPSSAENAHWLPMQELLHARARKGSPTLPLILTGAQWGDAKALVPLDLKPFAGSNVLYTFHYYDPHTYTHQGVEGDEGEFLSGLQWPAAHDNVIKTRDAALARLQASKHSPAEQRGLAEVTRKLLADYEGTAHDRDRVHADFAAVAKWADEHGIPHGRVLLGEFGCVASANKVPFGEDRARWFRTIRETAQEFGFPWALWAYKGYGGMGLYDEAGRIDQAAAQALDLHF